MELHAYHCVPTNHCCDIASIIHMRQPVGRISYVKLVGMHKIGVVTRFRTVKNRVFNIDDKALFIVENTFNVIGADLGKRKMY